MARRVLRLVVAAFLAAAAGLPLPSGPAAAATCSSADDVGVVVDFHELGGGVQSGCVAGGGGRTAASLFEAAGFALDYVQRQPGFVCRVSGQPASDPCVNTPPSDAYWALYWSDGTSSGWTYATLGAGSQTVPDGGSVALSWTGSSARSQPGMAPAVHKTAPSPSAKPTTKPTPRPTTKPSARATATPTPAPTPTAGATENTSTAPSPQPARQTKKPASKATKEPKPLRQSATPSASPRTSPTAAASATPTPASSDPADPDDDGLPTWVGPAVVAVLFAAGAAVAVVRRRRSPS